MKVLIVEKEKTIRQSLFHFLERYSSFEVSLAQSRKEGMSLSRETQFDIILCDQNLPDGEGLEMLKEILHKNPKLIPILLTVRNDNSLKEEAEQAGIRGYLVKPFDLKQLEEAIGLSNAECGVRNAECKKAY